MSSFLKEMPRDTRIAARTIFNSRLGAFILVVIAFSLVLTTVLSGVQ